MLNGMNMGNMQGMMKQVQKMQREMEQTQKALEEEVFEVSDRNQLVTVKMTGKRQLTELDIKPDLVDPDDVEMLQDIVLDTINETLIKIDEETEARMGKFAQGLNLPF